MLATGNFRDWQCIHIASLLPSYTEALLENVLGGPRLRQLDVFTWQGYTDINLTAKFCVL